MMEILFGVFVAVLILIGYWKIISYAFGSVLPDNGGKDD
jgi:hypothetical protein